MRVTMTVRKLYPQNSPSEEKVFDIRTPTTDMAIRRAATGELPVGWMMESINYDRREMGRG